MRINKWMDNYRACFVTSRSHVSRVISTGMGLVLCDTKIGATITIPSQVSRYSILPRYRKCAVQFQCRSEFASLSQYSVYSQTVTVIKIACMRVCTVTCSNYTYRSLFSPVTLCRAIVTQQCCANAKNMK